MLIETILAAGLNLFSSALPEVKVIDPKAAECLAKNMYFEARNQGIAGQLAVTSVVLNRVNDSRFPDTICEVIEQGPTRESWKKNGMMHNYFHES